MRFTFETKTCETSKVPAAKATLHYRRNLKWYFGRTLSWLWIFEMVFAFYIINNNSKEVTNIIHKIRQVEYMAEEHTEGKLRERTEGSSKEAEESREEPFKLCKVIWPLSQALCKTS